MCAAQRFFQAELKSPERFADESTQSNKRLRQERLSCYTPLEDVGPSKAVSFLCLTDWNFKLQKSRSRQAKHVRRHPLVTRRDQLAAQNGEHYHSNEALSVSKNFKPVCTLRVVGGYSTSRMPAGITANGDARDKSMTCEHRTVAATSCRASSSCEECSAIAAVGIRF